MPLGPHTGPRRRLSEHLLELGAILLYLTKRARAMNQQDDLAALQAASSLLGTISTEVDGLEQANQTLAQELQNQQNTPEVDAAFADVTSRINALQTKLAPPPPPPAPAPAPAAQGTDTSTT